MFFSFLQEQPQIQTKSVKKLGDSLPQQLVSSVEA